MPKLIKDTWTPLGHSVLCQKHGPLIEIKRHCHNLARYFYAENPYDPHLAASWFQIASGIKEVKYASDLFDDLVMWCGPAIEYENAKSDFHSKLIGELTRFNFIGGGFEAYCDSFNIPSCPDSRRRGKINKINYHLKSYYENRPIPILFYNETLEHLKKVLSKSDLYRNASELFYEDNCTSERLAGLKVVYQIRNLFAHGAFIFSEPPDWNGVKSYDIGIINSSSRILLMTIQMLILSVEKQLKLVLLNTYR